MEGKAMTPPNAQLGCRSGPSPAVNWPLEVWCPSAAPTNATSAAGSRRPAARESSASAQDQPSSAALRAPVDGQDGSGSDARVLAVSTPVFTSARSSAAANVAPSTTSEYPRAAGLRLPTQRCR